MSSTPCPSPSAPGPFLSSAQPLPAQSSCKEAPRSCRLDLLSPGGSFQQLSPCACKPEHFLPPPQAVPASSQLPALFNVALFKCQLLHHSLSINDLDNTLASRQGWGGWDLLSLISFSRGCLSNLQLPAGIRAFSSPTAHAKLVHHSPPASCSWKSQQDSPFLGQVAENPISNSMQNFLLISGEMPFCLIYPPAAVPSSNLLPPLKALPGLMKTTIRY